MHALKRWLLDACYIDSSPTFFIGCFLSPRYCIVLWICTENQVFSRSISFRGFLRLSSSMWKLHATNWGNTQVERKEKTHCRKNNTSQFEKNRKKNRPQETRLTVNNNTVTKSKPKSSHRLYVIYVPTNVLCIEYPSGEKSVFLT